MDFQFVFVHQNGPKLRRAQQEMVRSTAMYVTRRRKQKAAARSTTPDSEECNKDPSLAAVSCVNRRDRIECAPLTELLSPSLLLELGQPPEYAQTTTGLNAKLYRDYIRRTEVGADLVDEGFVLVGFRKPSLYVPEPDKKLCVYVGWLFASALTDAIRGNANIAYPYEELMAVREMSEEIAKRKPTIHVVTAIMVLGLFEILRSGSHATKHMAALEQVVATEGGVDRLKFLPRRQTMILIDMLHAVSFNTRLRFVDETPPVLRSTIHCGEEGHFFASSPLVIFNNQDFSLLSKFIDPGIADHLAALLQHTFDSIQQVFLASSIPGVDGFPPAANSPDSSITYNGSTTPSASRGASPDLDELADRRTLDGEIDVAQIILHSCALGSRIFFRTLERLRGLDDSANLADMRMLHRNLRFLGVRSWAGLPYIYAWLLLVGATAATDKERPLFVGQLARIAASYGGYHLEMLTIFFQNFLHLRRSLVSSHVRYDS